MTSQLYKSIQNLLGDMEEEDSYRDFYCDSDDDIDEVAEIPTEDLKPHHYKTLRQMIDFVKNTEKLKEENRELNETMKFLKNEHAEQIGEFEEELKGVAAAMEESRDYMAEQHAEHVELHDEIIELHEENKELEEENEELQEELKKLNENMPS